MSAVPEGTTAAGGRSTLTNLADFVALVCDQLGLPVTPVLAEGRLDEIPGWDSVQLLWLVTALENATGRAVSFPDLLEATTLADIYRLAVG